MGINGYFQSCDDMPHALPLDVNQIIGCYYTKAKTKNKLISMMDQEIKRRESEAFWRKIKRESRKEKCKETTICWFFFVIVGVILFSADIVGLVIVKDTECDLSLENGESKWFTFGVDRFLLI